MTPSGAAIVSWGEFAHGLPVRQEKPASSEQYRQLQWRAVQSIGHTKPYNLAERNCEHYATWVMGEKPESPQINFVVLLGLAGLLLALSR
jgi:hypothetical protein